MDLLQWLEFPRQDHNQDGLPFELKTPEQIVKDVERRLMPTYLEVLPMVLKKNQSNLDKHNQTVANLQRIASKIGVQWKYDDRPGEERGYEVSVYNTSIDKYLGRIRGYGDGIAFEARVDIETALLIIDVLKEQADRRQS